MAMDNKKTPSKVSWNAAEGIIMEISNRRSAANGYFIQNNINKAFSTLISIKQSVVQSFSGDERDELDAIEFKFHQVSPLLPSGASNSFNPKVREAHRLAMTIAKRLYPKYNDLLMDLLSARGYLVGEMSDASRMKF